MPDTTDIAIYYGMKSHIALRKNNHYHFSKYLSYYILLFQVLVLLLRDTFNSHHSSKKHLFCNRFSLLHPGKTTGKGLGMVVHAVISRTQVAEASGFL